MSSLRLVIQNPIDPKLGADISASVEVEESARTLPIRNEDVTQKVIREFKRMLAEKSLIAGAKLPPERELAVTFGVSRTSLRQALKVLEVIGVISQRVGDGTYLSGDLAASLGEPIEFLCLVNEISYHELYETRLILEPELAALAAERAHYQDIKSIRAAADRMEQAADDSLKYHRADAEFHHAIARAAGNRVCESVFRNFHESLTRRLGWTSKLSEREETIASHRGILESIEDRDAEKARRLTREHLLWSRRVFAESRRVAMADRRRRASRP